LAEAGKPLALARMGGNGDVGPQATQDPEARFDVSEVPEPTTITLGALMPTVSDQAIPGRPA
jgi:hypothetical protein